MSSRNLGFLSMVLLLATLLLLPLLALGQLAKDFTLEDINAMSPTSGEQITLSQSEGAILVLLFITPQQDQAQQRQILTSLTNGLWASYQSAGCFRFFVIGGFAQESRDDILGMRPNLSNATFPILYDPNKEAWGSSIGDLYRNLEDSNIPLAVVIDHDFNISNTKAGVADYENYNPQLVTWVDALGPEDTTPPSFENYSPPNNATDVGLCTAIEFDILDQCGVDMVTFSFDSGEPGASVVWTSDQIQGGYHIVVFPSMGGGCWEAGHTYSCNIDCQDLAGNRRSDSYRFDTVAQDTTHPEWANKVPAENATNVDPDIIISSDIYDDESCIDDAGIQLFITEGAGGTEQEVTSGVDITPLDDHEGYHVVYDHPTSFNTGDVIEVRLYARQYCGSTPHNASYTFTVGAGGPSFTNKNPQDGATDVPPGQYTISVDVIDSLYGIDPNSIQLSINGEGKPIGTSPIDNGYNAWFDHSLADSQAYTIRGSARNLEGMTGEDSWSFTTVDNTPPVLTSRTPANNAYNVAVDTDIFFSISDSGVGVNQSAITLAVNGSDVTSQLVKQQAEPGDDALINCTFNPPNPFAEGQTVTLMATARDKNGNIMAPVEWSFTCSAVPAVAMAGWGATGIYVSDIGEFEAWALVEFGEGMDMIRNVQMYVENAANGLHYPVGIFLDLIGYFEGHGVFYYHEYMTKASQVGMLPIYEIAAEDIYGTFSSLWPYLTIVNRSRSNSPPRPEKHFDPTDVPWRIEALMDKYGATLPDDPSGIFHASLAGRSAPQNSPVPLVNTKPVIFVGGFYPPAVDISQTSEVLFKALVVDPNGPEDIERVEIYLDGMPTGIMMLDDGSQTDDEPGDGFYVRSFTLEANSRPPGFVMLQIVAFDYAGNVSNVYPYITVEP